MVLLLPADVAADGAAAAGAMLQIKMKVEIISSSRAVTFNVRAICPTEKRRKNRLKFGGRILAAGT